MAASGSFLCGCAPSDKRGYSGNTKKNPLGGDPVYTDQRWDEQGHEVCPEHGERFFGLKSDDKREPHYVINGDGVPPSFVSPDKTVRGVNFVEQVDRRDNRDPQTIGEARLRAKSVAGNGFDVHPYPEDGRTRSDFEAFGG